MKVSKWGNSLAIRLPTELAGKLGVKEGDEIVAVPGISGDSVTFKRKKTREELWARVDEIRKKSPIPEGYKFKREDAYEDGEY